MMSFIFSVVLLFLASRVRSALSTSCFQKYLLIYATNKAENSTNITMTDVKISVTLSEIDKLISDCSKARFVDSRDTTSFVSFTYDNCSETVTNFWLENQTYPASTTPYSIRMYFDCDSSAPSTGLSYPYISGDLSENTDLETTVIRTYYKCGSLFGDEDGVCGDHGTCGNIDDCTCSTGYRHDSNGDCTLFNCSSWLFSDPRARTEYCLSRGNCSEPDLCSCETGFYGTTCLGYYCNKVEHTSDKVCSTHGICVAVDSCNCSDTSVYYGEWCHEWKCYDSWNNDSASCSGSSGSCTDHNVCTCSNSFRFGDECQHNKAPWIILGFAVMVTISICCFYVICCCGSCCCIVTCILLKKTEIPSDKRNKILKAKKEREEEMEQKLLKKKKKEEEDARGKKAGMCTIL